MEDMEAVWVDIVSRVVTPRATRAGTACAGISYLSVCLSVWEDMVSRVVTPRATRAGTACAGISYLSVCLSVCLSGWTW